MQRRRSVPHTFQETFAAEKARLEAQLADLKPGPELDAVRKKIRQLDIPRPTSVIGSDHRSYKARIKPTIKTRRKFLSILELGFYCAVDGSYPC